MYIKAKAKINIGLDIINKRPDGYHNIRTIMKEIDLYDELFLEPSEFTSITCDDSNIPLDGNNLVIKAKEALERETGRALNFKLILKKKIPVGAGLAGGSADGAAILKALNEVYSLGFSLEDLQGIGKSIGADLPFCLQGGCALAEGVGDRLKPIPCNLDGSFLIVFPNIEISTEDVYRGINEADYGKIDIDKIAEGLAKGNFSTNKRINIMETCVFEREDGIKEIKDVLYARGAKAAFMTGSGSSVVGYFEKAYDFSDLSEHFKDYRLFILDN